MSDVAAAAAAAAPAANDTVPPIHVLSFYHPYAQGQNQNHASVVNGVSSKKIQFDIKQNATGSFNATCQYAVTGFHQLIQNLLAEQLANGKLVLVLVPSSNSAKGVSAVLKDIAVRLQVSTDQTSRCSMLHDLLCPGTHRMVDVRVGLLMIRTLWVVHRLFRSSTSCSAQRPSTSLRKVAAATSII